MTVEWQAEKPTHPGYYWGRAHHNCMVSVIFEVCANPEGALYVMFPGQGRAKCVVPLHQLVGVDEWCGPLNPPP